MGRTRQEQSGRDDTEPQGLGPASWLPFQTDSGIISARQLLQSTDIAVRCAGIEALGSAGGEWAVRELVTALRDRDERLSVAAAEALGRTGDASAIAPLIRLLQGGSWYRSSRLVLGIGTLGIVTSVTTVLLCLSTGPHGPRWDSVIAPLAWLILAATMASCRSHARRRAAARALARIARNTHSPATRAALPELRALRLTPTSSRAGTERGDTSYRDAIREIEAHSASAAVLTLFVLLFFWCVFFVVFVFFGCVFVFWGGFWGCF